jgi:hypothetical protein
MKDTTVVIRWPASTETLYLGHLETLREGSPIISLERWTGYPELTRYRASVETFGLTAEACKLSIRYRRNNNSGQALENEAWGISVIEINRRSLAVTAEWIDDEPEEYPNATGDAMIVTEADIIDLGSEIVEKQKRRQAAFRKKLLDIDQRCVLSGEATKEALEASHLVDVKAKGGFGASNGILLRADLHKLFDRGILKIRPDGTAYFSTGYSVSAKHTNESKGWKLPPEVLQRVSKRLTERGDA